MNNPAKARLIFLIIFLLFMVPMILARVFYHHREWLPRHTVNHGQLLSPPVSLQEVAIDPASTQHRWVLLFLSTDHCDDFCWKSLYTMRQIQRALGKDMDRLQRVMLTPAVVEDVKLQQWLDANDTAHWQVSQSDLTRALGQPAAWYVIDPLGNIILSYAANKNPETILDDLKYLMRVSNIG
jgi:cytochrome oxidase Cu insertion factor (SCO1/SenC/PrrC family)